MKTTPDRDEPANDPLNGLPDAALAYGARGWRVFPCWSPLLNGGCTCGDPDCDRVGKHPLGQAAPHGRDDATTDPDIIRNWWRRWPEANIAIATGPESGLVVLDCDPVHDGEESLIQLEHDCGALPDSPVSITGGGGSHTLFAHPRDRKVTSRVGLPGYLGLDVRADGAYIIAPPSRHRSGRSYAWNVHLHPDDAPLAPCPAWLIELANAKPNGGVPPSSAKGGLIPEGKRHTERVRLAGAMRRVGATEGVISAALLEQNATRCDPPDSEAAVLADARDMSQRYEPEPQPKWLHRDGDDLEADAVPRPPPELVPVSRVRAEPIEPLLPGILYRRKLHALDGDPGLGKTTLALDLCARLTRGLGIGDVIPGSDKAINVAYFSAEDDAGDTLRPRLEVAGADLERVFLPPEGWLPALPDSAAELEGLIRGKEIGFLVLDPGVACLAGEIQSHRDQDVRRALAALREVLARNCCGALLIRHLNKQTTTANPLYRGGGSIGWIGAMRVGFLVGEDPNNPDARILAPSKTNLSAKPPALRFRVESAWAGEIPTCRIRWEGRAETTARELLSPPVADRRSPDRQECAEWLAQRLTGGTAVARAELLREAAAKGFSESLLKRAGDDLGVRAEREGRIGGGTLWSLPVLATPVGAAIGN